MIIQVKKYRVKQKMISVKKTFAKVVNKKENLWKEVIILIVNQMMVIIARISFIHQEVVQHMMVNKNEINDRK